MINLKGQIIEYDISKTHARKLVQGTWGPDWDIDEWLELVGARRYYGDEGEQPTLHVVPWPLSGPKTNVPVIYERDFWKSLVN